ncbi:putative short-chain dehydrogenase reductase sdr protein [Lasiodiplodia theobromae]|uniref:Short-chain dehydrogenase/reductase SDR n=1 Tax=Lasiodiplodia theobromae TaxID=45133 RepID=UPI0015C3C5A8|nr:Short-chain dehydrogenase/reductase SDR [Lasiodiplodia theobromae]KAF4537024.1 Short-chain dehydrogenase/reductase SDR [Lasiodiplodia theobromae]KAF9636022.1 putative short-chain dehydrogenase reductase sdr protein [Lasiodiplodia theobromae]
MTELTIEDQQFAGFKDSVVLITGGSSGIGLATAQLAEKHGAKVVVGDINPLPTDAGKDILYVPLDVTSWDSQSNFFKKSYEKHGRIDHVFANAGQAPKFNFLDEVLNESGELQEPNYDSFAINQRGIMNTTILALHYMKKQPSGGSIVVASSIAGIIGFPELDYSVAKHALFGFARAVAHNLRAIPAHRNPAIRINTLAPSWTVTNMVPAALAQLGANMQEPDVVARAAGLLLVDSARHNQVVLVHGGRSWELSGAFDRAVEDSVPLIKPEVLGVFGEMRDWATYDKKEEK